MKTEKLPVKIPRKLLHKGSSGGSIDEAGGFVSKQSPAGSALQIAPQERFNGAAAYRRIKSFVSEEKKLPV